MSRTVSLINNIPIFAKGKFMRTPVLLITMKLFVFNENICLLGKVKCSDHIETSLLIFSIDQLTGSHVR